MIKVKLPSGRTLALEFSHPRKGVAFHPTKSHPHLLELERRADGPLLSREARSTNCDILEVSNGAEGRPSYSILSRGMATLFVDDQFQKALGRKISLRRALKYLPWLKREDRTLIWETYLKRKGSEKEEGNGKKDEEAPEKG